MPAPDPYSNSDVWDTLEIAGYPFSGTFEWGGSAIKRKIDNRMSGLNDPPRFSSSSPEGL